MGPSRDLLAYDWQHIIKPCWGCRECQPDRYDYKHGCNGNGIYDEAFIPLERWHLGGRVFHRPVDRRRELPEGAKVNLRH